MSHEIAATEPFTLETAAGRRIDGLLDRPAGPAGAARERPAVVVCHGFKGFMDWGFFPPLAELLASRGFVVVRFNFSGSGMRPGEERAGDPEGFRRNTFTREQEDLDAVLGALGTEVAGGFVDRDRIGLFGHSRGGGAAVLAAGGPAWRDRVRALVTWASVATFDRYGEEERSAWREAGEWVVVNSRTGQELPIAVDLLDDLERNREALDIRAAAAAVRAPWLIVHGADDASVPALEGRELLEAAGGAAEERRELLEIPEAGHTFNAVHPFAGPTPQLIEALNATQRWFRAHLGD